MKKLSLLIAVIALFSSAAQAEVLLDRARLRPLANGAVVVTNPNVVTTTTNPNTTTTTTDDTSDTTVTSTSTAVVNPVGVAGAGVRGVNNVNTGNEVNVNQNHTKRNAGAAKHKKNPKTN